MENKSIRHLFIKSFTGALYIPDEVQTAENLKLINNNLKGFKAISRYSKIVSQKFWIETNKGKIIKTPTFY